MQQYKTTLLFAGLIASSILFASCGSSSGSDSPPSGLSYATNPAFYALNVLVEDNAPSVSGTVTDWEVSPDLPVGLLFDTGTGVISGTATAASTPVTYTVSASSSLGVTSTDLVLAVFDIDPPTALTYAPDNPYPKGLAMAPLAPTVTSLVFDYSLDELSAPLPAGMQLDPLTGVISGTPLVRSASQVTVQVMASNPAGHTTANVSFDVSVRDARFAYVANRSDNTLGIFSLDSTTGQLGARGYALTGDKPSAVSVSPFGTAVYVANYFDGNLSVYFADNASGALDEIQTIPAGIGPVEIVVHPSGSWIYALSGLSGELTSYQFDMDTGGLLALGPNIGLGSPASVMVMHPTGEFLYVGLNSSLSIGVFAVDPTTGSLSFVSSVPSIHLPSDLLVDPSGKFLYAPGGSFNVAGYEIDNETGELTTIATSPWSVGAGSPFPVAAAISSDGTHLYTANRQANNVSQFFIDQVTGELSELTPFLVPAGTNPEALAIGGQDEFLFVTHSGSIDMHVFSIDAGGLLAPLDDSSVVRTGVNPIAMATLHGSAPLTSRTDHVYAANEGSDDISGFDADAGTSGTGDLTPIAGSPFASGAAPWSLAMHPTGRFLYSADSNPGSLSLFGVAAITGVLTPGTGIPVGVFSDVLQDPSGLYAFGVLPGATSQLNPFTVDATSGELSPAGSALSLGNGALYGNVHPTGRYLYVANAASGDITTASIFSTTGALSPIATSVTGGAPQTVVVHPSGRWIYAPNRITNNVSQYEVNALAGTPAALTPATVPNPTAGGDATDAAVHPTGKFLYVSNGTNNEILLFDIDGDSGLLTGVGATAVPAAARGVMCDASGRFVYVSTAGNQIIKFEVDPADGSLGTSSSTITGTMPRGLTGTRDDG